MAFSGRETAGHRFHHPGRVTIAHPAAYVETLRGAAVTCRMLGISSDVIEVNPFLADLIEAKLTPVPAASFCASYDRLLSDLESEPGDCLPIEGMPPTMAEPGVKGRFVLTVGGDHSIAMGTISGAQKATKDRLGRDIAVIWVDAHCDINTPETSDSGNIHGMPVAFLAGLAKEERKDIFGWIKDEHRISLNKLVYIGLRDVDRGEKKILRDHGIKAFSMHDIDR